MRKGFIIFAAISLGACFCAVADDAPVDPARAASRLSMASVAGTTPTSGIITSTYIQQSSRIAGDRAGTSQSSAAGASGRAATGAASRGGAVRPDAPAATTTGRGGTAPRDISSRAAADISRAASSPAITNRAGTMPSMAPISTPSVAGRTVGRAAMPNTNVLPAAASARTATRQTPTSSARVSRAAADLNTSSMTFGDRDYATCRDTYYQCMDEFCATKDAQMRRCACSRRVNDFDRAQEKLSKFEDKMLDFNERLLTTSMDKEDAAAINKASEGELAFQVDDKSPSQKILDTIMKKLNDTSADSRDVQSLAMISLSINPESVFDTIDSTLGAKTATKEGDALYRAALPVCKEIAAEVCSPDDISIAEAAYQMAVEQDCNTVAKAYESLQTAAIDKVREGGALLDMSRLQDHQTRNADDTLTCKSKMLEMLADDAVCGSDLGKCLDWSGKYIDPSTGKAILTGDLSKLTTTLTPPTSDVAKWSKMTQNQNFVKFLNAKKKYIEPAMAGCEDIASMVWNDFMDDALAQIKLAQNKKIEDMRQSCTSVTATCLTGQAQSITDFDARALSIFGVSADRTVNQLCQHIQTACTALMQNLDTGGYNGGADWNTGMTELSRDKSYDQIIATCAQVGRNCIVQNCVSAAGNFGLCASVYSINRKIVLDRTLCWDEVQACVNTATNETLDRIYAEFTSKTLVPNTDDKVACEKAGGIGSASNKRCLIAKSIWGRCDRNPDDKDGNNIQKNMITNSYGLDTETIMYWFGKSTASVSQWSCSAKACPEGSEDNGSGICTPVDSGTSGGDDNCFTIYTVYGNWTNCCTSDIKDVYGNCCADGRVQYVPVDVTNNNGPEFFRANNRPDVNSSSNAISGYSKVCSPYPLQFVAKHRPYGSFYVYLFCAAAGGTGQMSGKYTTDGNGKCDGRFLEIIAGSQAYAAPSYTTQSGSELNVKMSYKTNSGETCTFDEGTGTWAGHPNCNQVPNTLTGVKKMITY